MKTTFCILSVLLFVFSTKGQVFRQSDLYHHPGSTKVKGKYFNGSGGKGYWTVDKLDSVGRTIERKSFRKDKLLERIRYTYNIYNDIASRIHDNDINNISRPDTARYEYKYENDKIIFQKEVYSIIDSTVYKMTENIGDSIFTYHESFYNHLSGKKVNRHVDNTTILTYQNNLLTKKEVIGQGNSSGTISFEYFKNGDLKRTIHEKSPESLSGLKGIYVGGPGADDQSYSYSHDKKGRRTAFYTVVDGKTFKLATYSYK